MTIPVAGLPMMSMGRREILRLGGLSLMGLSLPDLLRGRAAAAAQPLREGSFGRAKSCILLFMWGGPAHQDTWDLKPDAPAEYRGEFRPIGTNVPGIRICEHFPLLARRADKLCLVRSMTHNDPNHTSATHFLLTGTEPPKQGTDRRGEWPSMGAVLSRLGRGRSALPPFVTMRPKLENDVPRFVEQSQGQWGGWLGTVHDPLVIDVDPSRADYKVAELEPHPELSVRRLEGRLDLLKALDRLEQKSPQFDAMDQNNKRAFALLRSTAGEREVFDLEKEPRQVRERYGLNAHGQSVLQARRLVERGVPLVTVFWPSDGIKNVSVYWDTHARNFIDLKTRLMPAADQAFSALLDDLSERGLLDETLVVWTGEFGRTPKVGQRSSDAGAAADGRDHWPGCFTSVLAGGGAKGGFVYGKSDKFAAFPEENAVAPADLIATVYHLLGVPEDLVLEDQSRRPQYVRPGKTIQALLR